MTRAGIITGPRPATPERIAAPKLDLMKIRLADITSL